MNLHHFKRALCGLAMAMLLGSIAHAAPPKLPANAIAEDTFLIATVDLTKVDPTVLETSAKSALGEKAGDLDEVLKNLKAQSEKFAGKGAESLTVVLRGDPDHQAGPEPVFYVQFKPGADQAPVEKQIREDEGENNPSPLEISHDGDFMVLRKKGTELPAAGSAERTGLFVEALGTSDKPVIATVIFNAPMIKSIQKDAARGVPPGLVTIVTDSKWLRMEMALGEAVKATVTIQSADEDAAKRVADGVTGLGQFLTAQAAQMKLAAPQLGPQIGDLVDSMSAFAAALKPQQSDAEVVVELDAKAVGSVLRGWLTAQVARAGAAPASKGGL